VSAVKKRDRFSGALSPHSQLRPISPPASISDWRSESEHPFSEMAPRSPLSIVEAFDSNMKKVIQEHNYKEYLKSIEQLKDLQLLELSGAETTV
jgi:hypothetical protein